MFIACRLAKAGFFNGDPEQVLNSPASIVEAAIAYETFESDYAKQYEDLNAPEK